MVDAKGIEDLEGESELVSEGGREREERQRRQRRERDRREEDSFRDSVDEQARDAVAGGDSVMERFGEEGGRGR